MTAPESVSPGTRDGLRTLLGVSGLVALVIGVLILIFPAKSGEIVMQITAAIIAAYTFVTGVVYLGSALFSRSLTGWARTGNILLGLLFIVGGVVLTVNLNATAVVLAMFLAITVGLLWIVEAALTFSLAKQSPHRGWTIFYGVIGLIAGIVMIITPLLGAITLWIFLGVSLVLLGAAQIGRAFSMRS